MMKRLSALILSGIMSLSVGATAFGEETSLNTEPTQGVNRFVNGTRQVTVKDIVLNESGEGVFKKNKNIYLQANHLQFEDGIVAEVTKGDLKVKKVKVKDDTIIITIDKESTEPSEITLTNVKLFLDESLPVGIYPLDLITEESEEYKDNIFGVNYGSDKEIGKFPTSSLELMNDFASIEENIASVSNIESITARRPVAFIVGDTNIHVVDKTYTAEQAPYISKEGYVMLPVRALAEIYPTDVIVKWDDATKTVGLIITDTVRAGSKIVSMKIGENAMNVNGISVAMDGRAELINGNVFIPLRDFAYLLACDESNITWDEDNGVAIIFYNIR